MVGGPVRVQSVGGGGPVRVQSVDWGGPCEGAGRFREQPPLVFLAPAMLTFLTFLPLGSRAAGGSGEMGRERIPTVHHPRPAPAAFALGGSLFQIHLKASRKKMRKQ